MSTLNISLPSKWLDLSNSQLLFVAKLFNSDFSKFRTQFLTLAFFRLSNARISGKPTADIFLLKIKGQKIFEMPISLLTSITNKLDWLLGEVTEVKPLKRILFASPVNYRLYNTTFEQFLTAENYYIAFSETNEMKYLNMLVASLYSLPLHKFNAKKISSRSKWFFLASVHSKFTVFLWFSGFRAHISNEFPELFDVSGNPKKKEPINIKSHIMGFVRGLTEGDITRSDSVYKSDTWTALYELNEKAKSGTKKTN